MVTFGRRKDGRFYVKRASAAKLRARAKLEHNLSAIRKILSQTSKKETLGIEFRFALDKPHGTFAQLALGGDNEVSRQKDFVELFYPQTNTRVFEDLVFTQNEGTRGKNGRILIIPVKYIRGPSQYQTDTKTSEFANSDADAGLVYREKNGVPVIVDILVEKSAQGKGLGKKLLDEFAKKFGVVRVQGPFSKQGSALARGYQGKIEVIE